MDFWKSVLFVVLLTKACSGYPKIRGEKEFEQQFLKLAKSSLESDTYTETQAEQEGSPVAVCVARTTPETGYGNPLEFNEVLVNEGNAWDPTTNKMILPSSGVYLFHLNAGAMPQSTVNMDLFIGDDNYIDILRLSDIHTGADTLGRSFIRYCLANESVYVGNPLDFPLYSDSGRQTSLSVLSLENHLGADPVIFSASNVQPVNAIGPLTFAAVEVNVGDGFIEGNSSFVAPVAGIYFFALSAGLVPSTSLSIYVEKNGVREFQLWRQSNVHQDVDTTDTCLMLELQAKDVVGLHLTSGETFSDFSRQTFFGGFLYNPVDQAAWSVAKTRSSLAADPLSFETEFVNTDGIFNTTDNIVYISKSGVYYVSLTITANRFSTAVDVFIVRGRSRVEANIYRETSYTNGHDVISQALMLRLEAGNTLRVVVRQGTLLYSDIERQISFTGFLIQP